MPAVIVKTFGGIAPRVPARYLNDAQAQVALNCPAFNGSLQPLPSFGSSLLTLPKTGTPLTLYRFGQDLVSDTQYWFHWAADVDVCRSQIAGDTSEWTFYTGDGYPKATYAAIATSGSAYPAASRRLGLPAPTTAPSVSGGAPTGPELSPAVVVLGPDVLQYLGYPHNGLLEISTTTDEDASYTAVDPQSLWPEDVSNAINAATGLAVTSTWVGPGLDGAVTIKTDATGESANLFVRYVNADTPNPGGTFSYDASPDKSGVGEADTAIIRVIIEDNEIGSIGSSDTITITTDTSTVFSDLAVTTPHTAASLVTLINNNAGGKVVAGEYGSCVVITGGTEGVGGAATITYSRKGAGTAVQYEDVARGSGDPQPAQLLLTTQDDINPARGKFMSVKVGDVEMVEFVEQDAPGIFKLRDIVNNNTNYLSVKFYGTMSPFAILETSLPGTNASIRYRVGDYPSNKDVISNVGVTAEKAVQLETRVYTYTWVAEEAGFAMESAPAPASASIDVEFGGSQTVDVSGFDTVPSGAYLVTAKRIYRAVNGVYLFVAEVGAATTSYTDAVEAAALGEELPSLYWSEPPEDLKGLTNLPNGMMAGFRSRDVYFCEPYRPYAWPETYMQTVDHPVVGLGRMDTTLAVLTTGVPYFLQGSHPDSVAVVKSDIEQACVSKRSIASLGGAVIYASPDGLVMLSPGGSRVLTEGLFDYKVWQSYFAPESINAYIHDNKYIAFYDNGATQGGFIFDVSSGQFTLHDMYATAGYQDRQRDKLFLADTSKALRVWEAGPTKTLRWRSKKFTMPEPVSFSCAQIEAENYPMTMRVYLDGALLFTKTVASRNPFRLPSKVGRDWEFEIEGDFEVFVAGLATSMTEFAGA